MFGQGFNSGFFAGPSCFTDTTDIFKDNSGIALYTLDYDASSGKDITTNTLQILGDTSCIATYRLNGGSADLSGNYNGTDTNITYTDGYFGQCASFNGSSSFITLPGNMLNSLTAISASAWVYRRTGSSDNYEYILSGGISVSGQRYGIAVNDAGSGSTDNKFYITDGASSFHTNTVCNYNTWYHVVYTWSGTELKFYVNGSLDSTFTAVNCNFQSSGNGHKIGEYHHNGNYEWEGEIDQVRIFNKAISASEVTTLYNEIGEKNGTPTNVDFGVGGKSLYGARFNGSSSRINLPTGSLGFPSNNFSVSCWFNSADIAQNDQSLFWFQHYQSPVRFGASVSSSSYGGDNDIRFYCLIGGSGNQAFTNSNIISGNTWYHAVFVKSSVSGMTIYINGSSVATNTSATGNVNNNITSGGANSIGVYQTSSSSGYFDGRIDQVRLFNKALSSSEVSKLYGGGAGEIACKYTSTTNLSNVGGTNHSYYKFDNDVLDYSGNGYNGTSSSMVFTFGKFGQAAISNDTTGNFVNPQPFNTGDTISFWTKRINAAGGSFGIFGQHDGTYDFATCRIYYNNDNTHKIQLYLRNSTSAYRYTQTSYVADNGNWSHWVITLNSPSSDPTVYLNSVQQSVSINNSSGSMSSYAQSNARIGRGYINGTLYNMNGYLDQMRTFTSARTLEQIKELYNEKPEADTSNFKTILWKGDGSDNRYISNLGIDLETNGGLIWTKTRNDGYYPNLQDTVRGPGANTIFSNRTEPENGGSNNWSNIYGYINSFEANGWFTKNGSDGTGTWVNKNAYDYVGWNWKGGGDAVSNTDGTITSQVSANQDAGFSIVKYTSTGTSGSTVGHGLSSAPEIAIFKCISTTGNWITSITNVVSNKYLYLNNDGAGGTGGFSIDGTNITLNNTYGDANTSGRTYIVYCWHSVAGYSSIGTYSGGSTNTVPTGFKPSWVIVKNTGSGYWNILDSRRGGDSNNNVLFANDSSAESNPSDRVITFQNNGFSWNATTSGNVNASGNTYLYMAFK